VIIEDEEDILTLYRDYLSSRGHKVLNAYLKANNILEDIDKECPDIFLIDYRLPDNKNGIDIATNCKEISFSTYPLYYRL
jgi:DNA-binding response OmpR family regulator